MENYVRRDVFKLYYGWLCLYLIIVEVDGINKFFYVCVNRVKGCLLYEGV